VNAHPAKKSGGLGGIKRPQRRISLVLSSRIRREREVIGGKTAASTSKASAPGDGTDMDCECRLCSARGNPGEEQPRPWREAGASEREEEGKQGRNMSIKGRWKRPSGGEAAVWICTGSLKRMSCRRMQGCPWTTSHGVFASRGCHDVKDRGSDP
jgi:hypothetical protein